ncbi:MAG TPA: hypothetical protein VGH54_10460, partial [Mycobacterium sp.]|uniref:hypothetical protein n=1 Tax=Mycobacterium sp. TaxID=1785 RepID=UPI002F3E2B64
MAFRSSAILASATAVNGAVPVPTGAAINDIALVAYYMESATTVTPPTGFTLKTSLATTSTTRGRIDVFWKRLTAADTGTYSFTHVSAYRGAVCVLLSGRVTSGDPFDVAPGTIEGSANSTTSVNPGCTVATTGSDLVGFASNFAVGAGTWTMPAGMTSRQSGNTVETCCATVDAA